MQDTVKSIPEVPSVEVVQSIEETQATEEQVIVHSDPGDSTKEVLAVDLEQEQAQDGSSTDRKDVEKTKSGKRLARSLSPKLKQKLEEKKTRIMGKVVNSTL